MVTSFVTKSARTQTGFDENRDPICNDRPAGVGRNTARGDVQWTLDAAAPYTFMFARQHTRLPPGIAVATNGMATVQTWFLPMISCRSFDDVAATE